MGHTPVRGQQVSLLINASARQEIDGRCCYVRASARQASGQPRTDRSAHLYGMRRALPACPHSTQIGGNGERRRAASVIQTAPPRRARDEGPQDYVLCWGAHEEHQIQTVSVAGHKPQISAQVVVWVRGYAPIELFELAGDSTSTRRSQCLPAYSHARLSLLEAPNTAQTANLHGQLTFAQKTTCVVIDRVPISLPRGGLRWGSCARARRASATSPRRRHPLGDCVKLTKSGRRWGCPRHRRLF
jgi:hypothetical protein